MTELRSYQQLIVDRMAQAVEQPFVKTLGVTMPTGTGISLTIAALLSHPRLKAATSAARHNRPLEVLVIGLPELRDQLCPMLEQEGCTVYKIGHQMPYGVGVNKGVIPRTWDVTVILEGWKDKHPQWWYNHLTVVQRPQDSVAAELDYNVALTINSPKTATLKLTETVNIAAA